MLRLVGLIHPVCPVTRGTGLCVEIGWSNSSSVPSAQSQGVQVYVLRLVGLIHPACPVTRGTGLCVEIGWSNSSSVPSHKGYRSMC